MQSVSFLHSAVLFFWELLLYLCTDGHFEPASSILEKYYRTSWYFWNPICTPLQMCVCIFVCVCVVNWRFETVSDFSYHGLSCSVQVRREPLQPLLPWPELISYWQTWRCPQQEFWLVHAQYCVPEMWLYVCKTWHFLAVYNSASKLSWSVKKCE